MWRGVAATSGDLVVFIDADLRSFSTSYVVGLLGPLLTDPDTHLVKAVYERPLVGDQHVMPAGGGRVTELVARPLLNLHWPSLAGVIQPLAGEYAARRSLLEQLSFSCGYGVDFALLIDTARLLGVRSISQVDLGVRVHRHHDTARLGRMAAEILHTAWSRIPGGTDAERMAVGAELSQFERDADGFHVTTHRLPELERSALATLPHYRAALASGALPIRAHTP
jgi:glucosyl-3-phosphoglycerate synthase